MNRSPAVLLAAAALVVLAGCAGGRGTTTAAPSSAASAPSTVATTPDTSPNPGTPNVTRSPCAGGFQPGTVQLNERDNGATVCLAVGAPLEVYLRGSDDDRWATIAVDGTAIEPAPNGKRALMLGVTAGFYAGTRAGIAHLTSARDGQTWRVTVIVG